MNIIKPYKNYKPSNIAWLGDIPEHWEVRKLKHISQIETGTTPSKNDSENYSIDGLPWIKPDNLKGFKKLYDSKEKISQKGIQYCRIIPKGSILVCCIGTLGKMGIAGCDLTTNQQINSVIFKGQLIINDFGKYLIFASEKEYWRNATKSVVTMLNKSVQGNIKYCYPIISEQATIANFLDYKTAIIDRFIQKKKQLIKLLNEQKAGIINDAVTKGLNPNAKMKPSNIEWLGDIPEHWEVRKLKYIGTCQNGISAGAEYFGSGYPFVSYGDIYKNIALPATGSGLANSSERDRVNYSVIQGDIFFTRTSETIEEIGFTSTCLSTIENATFSGFIIRFRPYAGLLFEGYSKYYFRSNLHRRFFVKEMNLVTRASLSQDLLKKMPILLPSIQEQRQIAEFIDSETAQINTVIQTIEKEIVLTQEYRVALIAEAVTGKIDVRDYEIPETPIFELYEELEKEMSLAAEEEIEYLTEN